MVGMFRSSESQSVTYSIVRSQMREMLVSLLCMLHDTHAKGYLLTSSSLVRSQGLSIGYHSLRGRPR